MVAFMQITSFGFISDREVIRHCAILALLTGLGAYGAAEAVTIAIDAAQPIPDLRLVAAASTANLGGDYLASARMGDEWIKTGSIMPQLQKSAMPCAQ